MGGISFYYFSGGFFFLGDVEGRRRVSLRPCLLNNSISKDFFTFYHIIYFIFSVFWPSHFIIFSRCTERIILIIHMEQKAARDSSSSSSYASHEPNQPNHYQNLTQTETSLLVGRYVKPMMIHNAWILYSFLVYSSL